MYPDLSYLFHDIFGTARDNWTSIFKTFGVFLVFALVACGFLLKHELRLKEKQGLILPTQVKITQTDVTSWMDILLNALFIAVIGAKLPLIIADFATFSGNPAAVLFSSKGNWVIGLGLGAAMVAYYLYTNSKADPNPKVSEVLRYPSEKTNDIILLAGVSGVLGSKLFSALEDIPGFLRNPLGSIFSGAGLNVYGGIILAFLAVYWYVKRLGIKPIYMMDIGGMGIFLGYGLGRVACQLSGDGDWGIVAPPQPEGWFLPDWLWSQAYPNNVNNDGVLMSIVKPDVYNAAIGAGKSAEQACYEASGIRYCHELNPKVFPTPIYETVFSLIACALLFFNKHRFKVPGMIFFTYMIINGIERYYIETIRVNDKYSFMGLNMTQAQYISILFVIIGAIGWAYLWRKGKQEVVDG
jgi:phosphatidylglycerol---prolipoprotein diacylglyceryl transferase